MRRTRFTPLALAGALVASMAGRAHATPTEPQSCEAALERLSGQFGSCRLQVESTFAKKRDATKRAAALDKCATKFSTSYAKSVARYGAADCPATPQSAFASSLAQCTDDTTTAAHGGSLPTCGDDVVNVAGEQCDGADLGGSSCGSLGLAGGTLACTAGCRFDTSACTHGTFPASGQTTCWNTVGTVVPCAGTRYDGDLQSGASLAFVDNGDGTVSDANTGLTWEKLADDGGLHDKDTTYSWSAAFAHVADLNAAAFAGHADWRVPNIRELKSIVDFEHATPAVGAAFNNGCASGCSVTTCSCTSTGYHWTSTTLASNPPFAFVMTFSVGESSFANKGFTAVVRAVRGGA